MWPGVDEAARAGLREGRLAVQAARAAGLAGEPTRSIEWGRRAVLLGDAEGDGVGGVEARAELARRLVEVDASPEAVRLAEDAVRLAAERGVDPALAAIAEVVLARALLLARRPDDARRRAESAVAAARAAQDPALEVEALTTLAFLDEVDGDREAAAHRLGTALQLARAAREPGAELRAHYSLASMYYYDGDVTAALPVLRTAMTPRGRERAALERAGHRAPAPARHRAVRQRRPRGQPARGRRPASTALPTSPPPGWPR